MLRKEVQQGEIIRQVLKARKMTQQRFADLIGVNNSSVNQWITGRTKIAQENLLPVAEALGIDVVDLLTGRMPELDQLRPTAKPVLETVALPYLPGKAAARFDNCVPVTEQTFPVLSRWIEPGATYMVMQVDGHAMENELRDGSTVLAEYVPNGQLQYESGGIYAVQFSGRLVVRRIRENALQSSSELTLHADNPDFSTIRVTATDLECAWRIISILHQPVR